MRRNQCLIKKKGDMFKYWDVFLRIFEDICFFSYQKILISEVVFKY